jgi:uncharacterized membrane protein YkvA (DUF1232 family)
MATSLRSRNTEPAVRRDPSVAREVPIPDAYLAEAVCPEAEVRVRERLPEKLRRLARDNKLVGLAKEAYGYVTDPRVPHRYKILGVAALLYLIDPLDAIPDWIPGVGYVDDAAALGTFVFAVRKIIGAMKEAAMEVVSHAIAETDEAFARRGVAQVCLALWSGTLAACIGLIYWGARGLVSGSASPGIVDPFFIAAMLTAAFGLGYGMWFAYRVWLRYVEAPLEIREPLAYAIVSLVDWRQVVVMALPVIVLLLVVGLRFGLVLSGH